MRLFELPTHIDQVMDFILDCENITSLHQIQLTCELQIDKIANRIGVHPVKLKQAKIKYRHPHDERLTWSGLGRRPTWFKDALNKYTEDELLVLKHSI